MGEKKMKKKKNTVVTVIVMIILGAGILAGYFFLLQKKDSENYESDEQDEFEKLLLRDLDESYPATPREVVKLYSRMMKCYYSSGIREEKVEAMPELKEEIADYAANNRTITSYLVESAGNIVTWTSEEREYARVIANYTYKEDTQYYKVYEEFILRRDAAQKWKILGWRLAEEEDME